MRGLNPPAPACGQTLASYVSIFTYEARLQISCVATLFGAILLEMKRPPITHWSYSSLIAFLRNPLAWYKRYVEEVYDTPSSPSAAVGRAGHKALEHFYSGIDKDGAISLGLEFLRSIGDEELTLGKLRGKRERKAKRLAMEREYAQAIGFYLEKPPRYRVLGVEVKGVVKVEGLALPLKAVSDLVVESRKKPGALDIVDHKFVDSFSQKGDPKPLFVVQALFNYYVVRGIYGKEVERFVVHECKKRKSRDNAGQMRTHILTFADLGYEFDLFRRLVNDATKEVTRERVYLPNPSDMFEGEHSFDIYRMELL